MEYLGEFSILPVLLVFISQFVLGIGNTLYYSLGNTYMDDNTKKASTPMLLGYAFSLRTFGPVIGSLSSNIEGWERGGWDGYSSASRSSQTAAGDMSALASMYLLVIFLLVDTLSMGHTDYFNGTTLKNENQSSEAAIQRSFNRTRSGNARTFSGLLGFLTGYRLGQGLAPNSYNSYQIDESKLDLFTSLFNSVIRLTFEKMPYQLPYINYAPYYTPYIPYPPHPQNIFPTHLQPPIWYPPMLPPNYPTYADNPHKQPLKPVNFDDNALFISNQNNQRINNSNTQLHSQNEVQNDTKHNEDEIVVIESNVDNLNNTLETNTNETNIVTRSGCINITSCVEFKDIKPKQETLAPSENSEIAENLIEIYNDTINNTNTIEANEHEINDASVPATTMTPLNVTQGPPQPRDNQTGGSSDPTIPPAVVQSITEISNPNKTGWTQPKYPYPVYYHYGNHSKIENLSFTESPEASHPHFLNAPDYYDEPVDNYLPKLEGDLALPHAGAAEVFRPERDSFKPMPGASYYTDPGYDGYSARYNKKLEDSDFVPMKSIKNY